MASKLLSEWNREKWCIPNNWLKIETIEAHSEGEPLRIITSGFPHLEGNTILERRRFAKEKYDHLRTALMWEPRGHADMYGCILTDPVSADADFGILFIHNEGFSSMCGHGIIAITQIAFETGMIEPKGETTQIKIDTPAGLVTAFAVVKKGKVEKVYFNNVPSFVDELDIEVDVPGVGKVTYDLAFGGAYYAYVKADPLGIGCEPENFRELIDKGMAIKEAVMKTRPIQHPFEEDLNFLYGTIFISEKHNAHVNSRNVCIFAEGEVDRSPTGTGVSGRAAIHVARGELALNQPYKIESIIGSYFSVTAIEKTKFGPFEAIIPQVSGRAYITGENRFYINPNDTQKDGFILR